MKVSKERILKIRTIQKLFLGFLFFLIAGISVGHAQVNDYTPPGDWTDFTIRSLEGGEYLLIDGVNASDDTLTYLLIGDELLLLESDSSLTNVSYIENIGDTLYFFLTYSDGLKDIVYLSDGQITIVPTNQEWSNGNVTPVEMSNGTLFADLTYVPSGFRHPVIISPGGVQLLNGNPFLSIIRELHAGEDRIYSTHQDLAGNYHLGYYDIHKGYVLTSIDASNIDLISDNPSDTTHAIIVNHIDSLLESKIFKVVDTSFIEVAVPGGPYENIWLIYRNDDTNTSLFELTDFNGAQRLAKRENGIWTDLTAKLPVFTDIYTFKQSGNEAFIRVTISSTDRQLWYYQSTANGDTLANITPPGGPFDHIHYLRHSFDSPLSFEFEDSVDDEYMYAFENAQGNLFPPSPILMNPGGTPAERVELRENGVYGFIYDTFDHVYHQAFPGAPLILLNDHMNADGYSVCSTDEYVLVDLSLSDGTEEILFYNMDTVVELQFPERDSFELHRSKAFGELGCVLETSNTNSTIDSNIYTYTLINGQLIDITHPRWRNIDIRIEGYPFNNREFVGSINAINDSGLVRLWSITSEIRGGPFCNTQMKFFQEKEIISVPSNFFNASEIYFGSHLQNGLPGGMGAFLNRFNAEDGIEIMPGTTVDSGVLFEANIQECLNLPNGG